MDTEPKPSAPQTDGPASWLKFAIIGSELAGSAVAGVLLDLALGTLPWITIGLTLSGVVLAFILIVRLTGPMEN